MRLYRLNYSAFIALLVIGCSSPPEPAKIEWSNPPTTINEKVPRWQNNHIIVPAQNIVGQKWSMIASNFNLNAIQTTEVYYAIAHASRIVIKTSTNNQYLEIKRWLLTHGAVGKIELEIKNPCLLCHANTLYFYREPVIN